MTGSSELRSCFDGGADGRRWVGRVARALAHRLQRVSHLIEDGMGKEDGVDDVKGNVSKRSVRR